MRFLKWDLEVSSVFKERIQWQTIEIDTLNVFKILLVSVKIIFCLSILPTMSHFWNFLINYTIVTAITGNSSCGNRRETSGCRHFPRCIRCSAIQPERAREIAQRDHKKTFWRLSPWCSCLKLAYCCVCIITLYAHDT